MIFSVFTVFFEKKCFQKTYFNKNIFILTIILDKNKSLGLNRNLIW